MTCAEKLLEPTIFFNLYTYDHKYRTQWWFTSVSKSAKCMYSETKPE